MSDYLAEAKEKIDKAVAAYDAGVRPEGDVDALLCDAGTTACEALNRLYADEYYWRKLGEPKEKSVYDAVSKIIKSVQGKRPHFNEVCLPVTANALRSLGYKPPENAEKVVAEARSACDAIRPEAFNLGSLVAAARAAVKKLADATCGLARQLRSKEDWRATRRKLLKRARNLLVWGSVTLGAAMIGKVVDTADFKQFSDAGKAAICVVATQSIHECTKNGNDQHEKDIQEEREANGDEPIAT